MLVNGVDDLGEDEEVRKDARVKVFQGRFPEAKVKIFDSVDKQGGFFRHRPLRDEAKAIVKQLQLSPGPVPPRVS